MISEFRYAVKRDNHLAPGTCVELIKKYPISSLKDISLPALKNIKGIGETKAIELLATIELGKRIFLMPTTKLTKLTSAYEIYINNKYFILLGGL